jgi:hypothetical protein
MPAHWQALAPFWADMMTTIPETTTGIGHAAAAEISDALRALLADVFALYVKRGRDDDTESSQDSNARRTVGRSVWLPGSWGPRSMTWSKK